MPLEWNDKFCIGINEIDEQHKTFLDMLNKAMEAYRKGLDTGKVYKDIELHAELLALRNYAFTHFSTEEAGMIKYNYSDFITHKKQHDSFIKELFSLEDSLAENRNMTLKSIICFSWNWFKNHIVESDMKFGEFIKNQFE